MERPQSRLRMIHAALDLFHLQGVNATSIDQILKKSNTGKGQFSHYFKTKDGLIRETFNYLDQMIRTGEAPTGYDLQSWEDLDKWFQSYIDFQKSVNCTRSCPMGTIGSELSEQQEIIRKDIQLFLEWSRGKLARFFAEKKASKELAHNADPDGLADMCIAVMQGGMLLTKIKRNTDMFENAATQTLQYIELLKKP